jgi:hypothetical protein
MGCKANTESSMNCEEYTIHWHYADPSQYEALIDLFSRRIMYGNKLLEIDTMQSNSQFSTLLFKQDSKIVRTLTYGKNENKGVVIIYEPVKSISSTQSFPDFFKEILSLDLKELN